MTNQEKFDKLDAAMRRLGLTNRDIAILLNVTSAMVSRYRKDASGIGRRDREKLPRAAKAVKWLHTNHGEVIKEMSPKDRAQLCYEALHDVAPDFTPNEVFLR